MKRVGTRKEVMNQIAKQTAGGLKKKDLKYNKFGKIVSKKLSNRAKKENRLQKAGYYNIKGQFGSFKMNGGMNTNNESGYNESGYNSNNESGYNANNEINRKPIINKEELRQIIDVYAGYTHGLTKEDIKKEYGPLNRWNISQITDMSNIFYRIEDFNNFQGLKDWDVSKVENMYSMFYFCKNFNVDLSSWEINQACDTILMFNNTEINKSYLPKKGQIKLTLKDVQKIPATLKISLSWKELLNIGYHGTSGQALKRTRRWFDNFALKDSKMEEVSGENWSLNITGKIYLDQNNLNEFINRVKREFRERFKDEKYIKINVNSTDYTIEISLA